MPPLLSSLEENRWSWVREGIDEFRKGFLRLIPTQNQKKEVLIGVYGPTQVGKTTLILKILGIREDKMKELSKALRGKRAAGNSATVTTTIYHRSPDEQFVIIFPDGKKQSFLTLEAFEEGMEQVRGVVESNRAFSIKPIHIYFSERYFNLIEIDTRSQDVTILDLPGDDSREEREVKHVERCLKEYIPHCRLCLVMEIGSQMVNVTQLTREHVRDWIYLPEQFRLVLTRTLTSSSVRDKVQTGEINSTKSYISHFQHELNRLLDGRKIEKIYPLEIGDSWLEIKEKELTFYETVSPWIDEVYQILIDEIETVESPEREVMQLLNLEDLATKRKKEEVAKLDVKKSAIRQEIVDVNISICSYVQRMKDIDKTVDHFLQIISKKGTLAKAETFTKPTIRSLSDWDARIFAAKTVSSLRYDFSLNLDQLQSDFEKHVNQWNEDMNKLAKRYGLRFKNITYTFHTTYSSIDRLLDRYFRRSTFEEDLAKCERRLQEAHEKTFQDIQNSCQEIVADLRKQIQKQIRAQKLIKEEHGQVKIKLEDKVRKLKKERQELQKRIQQTKEEWDHDIERTNELNQYLKKAFIKKVEIFQSMLESPNIDASDKWGYHMYWNIIAKDAERIIRHELDN
ncbi:hypothetical protein [Schinkia azotoformans]|uniref:hypothetical protein n=1 Tax=Schinkia azotoformans TaxID=1454 RepID=UPI002DBA92CA|nr:hypothetical protein [Schinkia azotoformans]MEC1716494.1 hypothetical protein [Schinkia azotoformans]MEC1756246.1 hypothetical protein [Schinkia azotoformans]